MKHPRRPQWSRRTLGAVAVVAMLLSPSLIAPRAFAATAPITLRFSFLGDLSERQNNAVLIKHFEKSHPNVIVSAEPVPDSSYGVKLVTEASAGTLPDILWTADGLTTDFAVHHVALNMNSLATRDANFNLGDLYTNLVDLGRVPGMGGLYMIPRDASVVELMYNRAMFKAANIPYPTANWTYAQFLDAARKLTLRDGNGNVTQYGISLNYAWWAIFVPWLEGWGGKVVAANGMSSNFSSPAVIQAAQAYQDLWDKYKVAVPPSFSGDAFATGKAAMVFGVRPWITGYRQNPKLDFDVQQLPLFPNGARIGGMGTSGYAVSATTKYPALAWDFVKFIISPAGQRTFAASYASVPIRKSLANDPSWRSLPGPPYNNQAFVDGMKFGITPPAFALPVEIQCGSLGSGEISTWVGNASEYIVDGKNVTATLKNLDHQINTCASEAAG